MTAQWIVLLREPLNAYGPFDDDTLASNFADFLTVEVDPAIVVPLKSPLAEMLIWRNRGRGPTPLKPENWPPHPGQVWQDRNGDRWVCTPAGRPSKYAYLTCLARQADDSAEEIWKLFGPLTLVYTFSPQDEELPF